MKYLQLIPIFLFLASIANGQSKKFKIDTTYIDTAFVRDSIYVNVVIAYDYQWGEPNEVSHVWETWKFIYYHGRRVKRIHSNTIATK